MIGNGRTYNGHLISPMQFAMLILLRKRPMYGYEVLKCLRDEFEEFWVPQTGSIYPALKRLEEHGLISSEKRDGTDYYAITEQGDEWAVSSLLRSPKDIGFISKYMEFLGKAEAELMEKGMHPEASEACHMFEKLFDNGDMNDKDEICHLLEIREHLSKHLSEINEELKKLESKIESDPDNIKRRKKGVKRQ